MRVYRLKDANGKAYGNYQLDFSPSPGHKRVEQSLKTEDRKLANEYARKIVRDAFDNIRLEKRPDYTFSHVVQHWLLGVTHDPKSLADMKQRIDWLNDQFGKLPIPIGRTQLEEAQKKLKVAPSTKNRYTAEMNKLMNHALIQEPPWIDAKPKYKYHPEPKGSKSGKYRWMKTQAEKDKLAAELPDWLRPMYWFALATGMRDTNVRLLDWSHVDMVNRLVYVDASDFKGDRTVSFPMNDEAMAILQERLDKHPTYVFAVPQLVIVDRKKVWAVRPLPQCSCDEWYAALEKLGMVGFRWHDLRHTWASWHARSGTPLPVLQVLGGWASLALVERYSHLCPTYTAQWANNSATKVVPVPMDPAVLQRTASAGRDVYATL